MGTRKRKHLLIAMAISGAAFAAAFGMAASLGGLNSDKLGAEDSAVAACDTDGVTTSYATAYNTTGTAGYKVQTVTVSGIADTCDGQSITVSLTGAGSASLQDVTSAVPTDAATSMTLTFGSSTLAESVTGVHVVVSGA